MSVRTIGLDLRMWAHPGIGRYIRELSGAMVSLGAGGRFRLLVHEQDERSIRSTFPDAPFTQARSKIYSFGEQRELAAFAGGVDLLHVPHFNAPLSCPSKLVVTIHDLIYLKQSRFSGSPLGKFYAWAMIGSAARRADAIIAVSDFTRRDLERAFPKAAGKTRVIHEAASAHFRAGSNGDEALVSRRYGLKPDYALFVGSLKAHKNLPVLLDAFESLLKRTKVDAQLVIVGKKDPKEKALLGRLEKAGAYARYLGEQPDEALLALYRGARVAVIPSLWEGFGLTAIEAMACGTPLLASDRSSLPEVVGEGGILFDPTRVDRLSEILYNVLTDKDLRKALSQKGLERAQRFSWETAARETLKLYDEVLS